MIRIIIAAALLAFPGAARAEVKSAGPTGFVSEHVVTVPASPARAYAALGRIQSWWNKAHTYSGDSANLRLELRAGGCFCERLPRVGGTIEHMRVVQAWPATMLRLAGGLGPLQGEGVAGSLSFALRAAPGGTEIRMTYKVGGTVSGGTEAMAAPVDAVLGEQLAGLRRLLAR